MPTADAEPVRYGCWKSYFECGTTRCSGCSWTIEESWYGNYCPYCGTKIDSEK